jgi:hypothetical protein
VAIPFAQQVDNLSIARTADASAREAVCGDDSRLSRMFWNKIGNSTIVNISGSGSATLNRLHYVSNLTGATFAITISGLSPAAGDVVGFICSDPTGWDYGVRLDAGGTVQIAGRVRYLYLTYSNMVLLRWDGFNWIPLVLSLDTMWQSLGATSSIITATTTNPGKGNSGTPPLDKVYWRRVCNEMQLRWEYAQTSGGSAGSGLYLFGIHAKYGAMDTNLISTFATDGTPEGHVKICCGKGSAYDSNVAKRCHMHWFPYDSSKLRAWVGWDSSTGGGDEQWNSGANTHFGRATLSLSMQAAVPMAEW